MKNMTLAAIAAACNGQLYYEEKVTDAVAEATQVIIDSRQIIPGGVFIATPGERVDGHSFIPQVFEKGALGVVCQTLPKEPLGPCILVEDSFKALQQIATFYREQLDVKVVGITGSVGKTSTKQFIASVLEQHYDTWKTQGNYNNEIGVPLTILQVRDNHQVLVLEMGINHFGEMTRLSSMGKPDVVVITNIGDCHLEFLEDRDGVLRAKTEIFSGMASDGVIILNGEDDKLITIEDVDGKSPVFFGRSDNCSYCVLEENNEGLLGSNVVLVTRGECNNRAYVDTLEDSIAKAETSKAGITKTDISASTKVTVHVPLPGKHMVNNAMAAMAVGETLGLSAEEIAKGIESVQATGGRSNIIKSDRYTIIDDCYNANPTSVKAAINLLNIADTSKVAILGDMFELGENEKELHAEVGRYAATSGIDVLICIGELSKNMYDAACEEQTAMTYYYSDKEHALAALDNILQEGDSILVKASHSMGFEKIVEYLQK
ncbi:MAG: UDP-N-acetylmuramoyl-tripeptide--D-alanyl-D-alanine ligase [Lachnospiraceae bacterium]|nr:UDP-N-acetylmuramoyl-tripeptide--D-alanyl-D-alanine ligase [Candidatus Colinaster scatohippi]